VRVLDVLLRHRTLPQPGGFEGFGLRPHSAPPDDLSVAHVGDVPHRQLDGRVALPATAVLAQSRDRHLSELAHLLDLAAEVGVATSPAQYPAHGGREALAVMVAAFLRSTVAQ
jgi:hypothetical protein